MDCLISTERTIFTWVKWVSLFSYGEPCYWRLIISKGLNFSFFPMINFYKRISKKRFWFLMFSYSIQKWKIGSTEISVIGHFEIHEYIFMTKALAKLHRFSFISSIWYLILLRSSVAPLPSLHYSKYLLLLMTMLCCINCMWTYTVFVNILIRVEIEN